MSDAATNEAATEAPADAKATEQGDPANEPLGEPGKKALEAERTARKELEKQLTAATAKLTEMERANETALERAQREAKEAQEAAQAAILDAFKEAAVRFSGIPQEDADLFLTGTDRQTLEKQLARLAARTQETPTAPRADLTQGGKENGALALNGDPLLDDLKSKLGIA